MSSSNNGYEVSASTSTQSWNQNYNNSWTTPTGVMQHIQQYSDYCSSLVDHSRNGYNMSASTSATIQHGRVCFDTYG